MSYYQRTLEERKTRHTSSNFFERVTSFYDNMIANWNKSNSRVATKGSEVQI
jgi:hypothetical protein